MSHASTIYDRPTLTAQRVGDGSNWKGRFNQRVTVGDPEGEAWRFSKGMWRLN